MKIVHVSCHDYDGGAARAAWRVHDSVRMAQVDSSMFVAFSDGHDPTVQQYRPSGTVKARISRTVRHTILRRTLRQASRSQPPGSEKFRDDRTKFGTDVASTTPSADIYHLHQITEFVDYRATLSRLAARAPIVWTLHERTPFTGGCHYSFGCDGFAATCGSCPQLGSSSHYDLSHSVWLRKSGVYNRIPPTRFHVVGASHWIAAEAQRSSLFNRFPISVIPYGIDTDVFRPMPEARRLLDALGVSPTARIVLFVSDWMGNPRKGFDLLDAALHSRPLCNVALVSLGRGDRPRLQSQMPHVHLGGFTEDRMVALAHSLADVFVIPSRQDNLPNTVLEAMACGTPVVGFKTGGIPEMVRDGVNGLLAEAGDVADLADALATLLADEPRRAAMARAARDLAEREYTRARQGERYLRLYESVLERQSRRTPDVRYPALV